MSGKIRSNKKAFTLLEILLVVAIIAILAGIVILAINPSRQLAATRNSQRVMDINTIHKAVYQYAIDIGSLPTTITSTPTEICRSDASDCTGLIDLSALTDNSTYLTSIPLDPRVSSSNGTGYMIYQNPSGRPVVYASLAELDQQISTISIAQPTVISTDPTSAANNISPGRSINATFSEAMDPATITNSTFILEKGVTTVSGTISYSGLKATFFPDTTLDANSTYNVRLTSGVKNVSGSPLVADSWNFTTSLNYHDWNDQGIGYTAPTGDAYYPSVIYDVNGFGSGIPRYRMWYSDGTGSAFLVASSDGVSWGAPVSMAGVTNVHHLQMLYDANCFGVVPCNAGTVKYKIWFWDIGATTIYSISSIATADSADGINWINQTTIMQNPAAKLVQDPDTGIGWNRGTYGPVSMFYQSTATDVGTDPWDYKYVMYYNGTNGSTEDTGLAYSSDGLYWSAYTENPVLRGSQIGGIEAWDCGSASYGTVFKDVYGYHYFYSGRGQDDGSGGCSFPASFNGIGYASSLDGKTWIKDVAPIFEISDGVPYRSGRIYTPSVINDGSGTLRMYFSAKDSAGGPKKIGYATLEID